jgi:hypothetical protein
MEAARRLTKRNLSSPALTDQDGHLGRQLQSHHVFVLLRRHGSHTAAVSHRCFHQLILQNKSEPVLFRNVAAPQPSPYTCQHSHNTGLRRLQQLETPTWTLQHIQIKRVLTATISSFLGASRPLWLSEAAPAPKEPLMPALDSSSAISFTASCSRMD